MNILYLCDEFPPFFRGGLGTYAIEMTKRFVKMGHNIIVFSRNVGNALTRDLYQGVEVHRPLVADATDILPLIVPHDVKYWPTESQGFFAETLMYNILSTTKAVNQLTKREGRKFDLVVANDWLTALAGILSKKSLKIPLIFHVHSTEQGRTRDGSPTIKEIERLTGRMADITITVSYAMRDELISLGYDERKIRVVYNGVDEKKYDPNKFSEEEIKKFREKIGVKNDLMILFIGRLTWVKGADTLVQAMPMILREVPNAKLVIVGKGDQENMLKGMVANFGIQERVVFNFQYVPEEERILYYAACDVAVFPSKYEPFGIVCTEAMSMGKPVVVGAKGTSGFREQIIAAEPAPTSQGELATYLARESTLPYVKRCGSHVDPHDPYDIAKFVVELLKNEKMRKELGKNARTRVLEKFTFDKAAEETMKIYEEVVNKAKTTDEGIVL